MEKIKTNKIFLRDKVRIKEILPINYRQLRNLKFFVYRNYFKFLTVVIQTFLNWLKLNDIHMNDILPNLLTYK